MPFDSICIVEVSTHPCPFALQTGLLRLGHSNVSTVERLPDSISESGVLILNNLPVRMILPETRILEAVRNGVGLFGIHDVVFPLGPNQQLIDAMGIRPAFDGIRAGQEGEIPFQDVMLARADPNVPSQRFLIQPEQRSVRHPILRGLSEFEIAEEVWAQNLAPGVQLLLNVEVGDRIACHTRFRKPVPICGCRPFGSGRVAFFSLGHMAETYARPEVVQLFSNAVSWLSGKTHERQFTFDVFLSFSSADEKEASELLTAGNEGGLKIFMAKRSIQSGDLWDQTIRDCLTQSRELAVLVTPASLRSEWVAIEWGAAWALGKRITPILLGCDASQLPDHLKRHQAIPYSQLGLFFREASSRSESSGANSSE